MSLRIRVGEVDDGRFSKLALTLDFKDVCLKCWYFNDMIKQSPESSYRCAISGECPGITLDDTFKSFLLYRLGLKTEDQHRNRKPR